MPQPGNLFAFGAQFFAEKKGQMGDEQKAGPQDTKPRSQSGGAFERASMVGSDNYSKLSEAVYGVCKLQRHVVPGAQARQLQRYMPVV